MLMAVQVAVVAVIRRLLEALVLVEKDLLVELVVHLHLYQQVAVVHLLLAELLLELHLE
jgi:hypothetical protein